MVRVPFGTSGSDGVVVGSDSKFYRVRVDAGVVDRVTSSQPPYQVERSYSVGDLLRAEDGAVLIQD